MGLHQTEKLLKSRKIDTQSEKATYEMGPNISRLHVQKIVFEMHMELLQLNNSNNKCPNNQIKMGKGPN
jgi:hypothetical protein